MDRREALKLLTGGAALAVTATAIETSTAFADGGTAAFRPTCSTANTVVTWSSNGNINRVNLSIAPGATTCTTGWTGTQQIYVTSSRGNVYSGTTNIEATFTTVGIGTTNLTLRDSSGGDLAGDGALNVVVIIRRVCTNNANSARKAYCCTSYSKSATWTRGGSDTWGGATSGNFGTGTTPVTSANGCTAP